VQLVSTRLETVLRYHQRTKHHFRAYARGPGYLDWANEPDPFRRYRGAPLLALDHLPAGETPHYRQALLGQVTPQPVDHGSLSRLFYDSLALSAWKQAGSSKWALRVNPSSGNLHPTEGYVLCGPISGLTEQPMVAHYAPREHALELRARIPETLWRRLTSVCPDDTILVGLSSIPWREAWKYGERAYRYCHHDVGHAIAALDIAAAGLGWETRLLDGLSESRLETLLGLMDSEGVEREHPDCLLAVHPQAPSSAGPALSEPDVAEFNALTWQGHPNRLSRTHVRWDVIEEVAGAACKSEPVAVSAPPGTCVASFDFSGEPVAALRRVVGQRRSAVAMDGNTSMEAEAFYHILASTLPELSCHPFRALPWVPEVHLLLFVHRVSGLAPGLYLLVRNPAHAEPLKAATDPAFAWVRPAGCPDALPLFELVRADVRDFAMHTSCHQEIAADGCFALAMLARFEPALREYGPWFYPRLHWECGLVGQVLYLEAVVNGIAATGMGCFFDDAVHEALGLLGADFQSLYHFTVGGAVEDPRLTTLPGYPERD
jgi:SagB-type dehydrogenase family enzyme